jgi:hypothetical protein
MILSVCECEILFPLRAAPEWSIEVERWYQLDGAAAALAELYWRERPALSAAHPAWIFLASPGASNLTDAQFTRGAPSPAKFVHTLPNVRVAPLLALMKWSGPVFCAQRDPRTVLTALSEAFALSKSSAEPVWIVSAGATDQGWKGRCFVLDEGAVGRKIDSERVQTMCAGRAHDKDLFLWLEGLK